MTEETITLLESLLPYLEYAAAHDLPNARHYLKLVESIIWKQP